MISIDWCKRCSKCGEITCENDYRNFSCFESRILTDNTYNNDTKAIYKFARQLIVSEFENENIEDSFTQEDINKLVGIIDNIKKTSEISDDISLIENNKVQDFLTNLSTSYKIKKTNEKK